MSTGFLSQLLDLLLDNQGYPKYAHERRVDIFLHFFMKDIISAEFGWRPDILIPEFPLRKDSDSNLTTNLDYLAYGHGTNQLLLIELKTTADSFKENQLESYRIAKNKVWAGLREDVLAVRGASKHKLKYDRLLEETSGIVDGPKVEILYVAPRSITSRVPKDLGVKVLALESLSSLALATEHQSEWALVSNHLRDCVSPNVSSQGAQSIAARMENQL